MTRADRMSCVDRLIDEVAEAVASERNQARGREHPLAVFDMEEPIACRNILHHDVSRYFTDPAYYFEQTLRYRLWRWRQFPDEDAPLALEVPAWLGHYVEYTFLGLEVTFDPSGVPLIQDDHPLTREPDLGLLKPVDFHSSGWMQRALKWFDDLSDIAGGRVAVPFKMLWWRGCLDLAIQLRGYEAFLQDTVERPQFLHDLLAFLTEQRCLWHEAYCRHFGVSLAAANIADDWINVPFVSPAIFADFVLPRYLEIERFHGGVGYIHSCGNQAPVQRYLLQIKSLPCLEVSPWTDLAQTLANVPPDKGLQVSLHPGKVLCASGSQTEQQLDAIVEACRGRDYNINVGLSPIGDDVEEFIRRVRLWVAVARRVMEKARKNRCR